MSRPSDHDPLAANTEMTQWILALAVLVGLEVVVFVLRRNFPRQRSQWLFHLWTLSSAGLVGLSLIGSCSLMRFASS